MSSLKRFEIQSIPTADGFDEGGLDENVEFGSGFNWVSFGNGKTPTEAFEKALAWLCEAWPEKVDSEDVVKIRAEFEQGKWPRESLSSLLEDWEERAEEIREAGVTPMHGIFIDVLFDD